MGELPDFPTRRLGAPLERPIEDRGHSLIENESVSLAPTEIEVVLAIVPLCWKHAREGRRWRAAPQI